MLLEKQDVLKMLRCPVTGRRLKQRGNLLTAGSGKNKTTHEIVDGYPVLIDFNRSIFKKEEATSLCSVVKRAKYGLLSNILRSLCSQSPKITVKNVKQIKEHSVASKSNIKLLIIGGGSVGQGMATLYEDSEIEVVAFDVYASPAIQFLADAHSIPLPDNSFDVVIVQAVLEHVVEPPAVVDEIYRVLNERGLVYAETPFLQHVHEGPFDFTRFTESGHRYLFRDFELINSGTTAGAGTQLLWSIEHFFRGLFRSRGAGKIIKLFFFWLKYCDCLIPEQFNIDAASGVFFFGRKRSSRLSPAEIVDHYGGAQK